MTLTEHLIVIATGWEISIYYEDSLMSVILPFLELTFVIPFFTESCGKTHPLSIRAVSWAPTGQSSTRWRAKRWWRLAWASGAASARSSHVMNATSSWPYSSRGSVSTLCLDNCWTWRLSMVSPWNTNAASWEPPYEQGMRNDTIVPHNVCSLFMSTLMIRVQLWLQSQDNASFTDRGVYL